MVSAMIFYLNVIFLLISAVAAISSLILAIRSRSYLREAISYLNEANAEFNEISLPVKEASAISNYIVDKQCISEGDSDLLFAENDDIVVISRDGFEVQCLPVDERRHDNVNVAFIDGQFLIATEETVPIEGSTNRRIVTHTQRYDPAQCHIILINDTVPYVKAYNSRKRGFSGRIERKFVLEARNVYCRREDAPFILSLSTVRIPW